MKTLEEFIKSTFIGGLLVILPVCLVAMIIVKGVTAISQVLAPIIEHLPSGLQYPNVFALALLIGACFGAGLLARTRPGQHVGGFFERALLNHVPGYAKIRRVVRDIGDAEEHGKSAAAFVEMDGTLAPAFVMEAHTDGRYTVFVPGSPNPASGAIYVVPGERVHPIEAPVLKTLSCIRERGVGSAALLEARHAPSAAARAK